MIMMMMRVCRTERQVMASLSHPFIVRLAYAFHSPDKVYMVMDFMQGGDLFRFMRCAVRSSQGCIRISHGGRDCNHLCARPAGGSCVGQCLAHKGRYSLDYHASLEVTLTFVPSVSGNTVG
jgi:hypothetical protein